MLVEITKAGHLPQHLLIAEIIGSEEKFQAPLPEVLSVAKAQALVG